jgi:hypothetical protein
MQSVSQTTSKNKAVCGWQLITAPKKNAGGSISFSPTSCRFAKVSYFYVGKKEYSISATNKYCGGRKHFGFKAALLLAPKR